MEFKQWLEGQWFHGSHRDFDKFDPEQAAKVRGQRQSADSLGQWFTSSKDYAKNYGPKIYQYELEPKNPWRPPHHDFRTCFVVNELASKYLANRELTALLADIPTRTQIKQIEADLENSLGTATERRNWIKNIPKWRQAEFAKEKAFRKLIDIPHYWIDLKNWLIAQGYDSILWSGSRIDLRKEDAPHDVLVMLNHQADYVQKHI